MRMAATTAQGRNGPVVPAGREGALVSPWRGMRRGTPEPGAIADDASLALGHPPPAPRHPVRSGVLTSVFARQARPGGAGAQSAKCDQAADRASATVDDMS